MTETATILSEQNPEGARQRLPNRRQCDCIGFLHGEAKGIATFSRYGDPLEPGRVAEIFIDLGRPGSDFRAATQAAAVAASIALQFGAPLDVIRNALPRLDDGSPAEPLGAAMDAIAVAMAGEPAIAVEA